MKSKSGLRAVKKSVHGKRGAVTRTYWVKASPKAEAQKGNRQISAGEMLKSHGLQIAARGAAHGAATYGAQKAAIHVGHAVGVAAVKRKETTERRQAANKRAQDFAGEGGALAGFLTVGAASAIAGKRLVYSGRRGATIRADLQRATIGGHIVASVLHTGSAVAGWTGAMAGHQVARNVMAKVRRK